MDDSDNTVKEVESINIENTKIEDKKQKDDKKANILCIISLILLLIPNALLWYGNVFHFSTKVINFISIKLLTIFALIAISIIGYVKVKFPNNKLSVILLTPILIIIGFIALLLIFGLLIYLLIYALFGGFKY